MAENALLTAPVSKLKQLLLNRTVSSEELTKAFLAQIAAENASLNAVVTVCPEEALASARDADAQIARGTTRSLTGIPLLHKDIFCTEGIRTTCGSHMLESFVPAYDATVVTKMKAEGAVMLGKCNMDEFAMGSSNETSFFGPVKNPWHLRCVPGGSSGGSAAALASGMAPLVTGTDTGGSIRQPASLCGVTGLKPTYGRVSRLGIIAFASSLDQIGPVTKSSKDAALLLNAISGKDSLDSTSIDNHDKDLLSKLDGNIKGMKLGMPKEYFAEGIDSEVLKCVKNAINNLEDLGAEIIEISLPHTEYAISTYYIIATAEASANLARFDAVRYGNRAADPENIIDHYIKSRSEGFGPEVKRRIILGTYVLSSGYNDAYYVKAQKVRTLIRNDFTNAFKDVDAIISPTAPTPAFKIGQMSKDPLEMYLADIFTIAANLSGICGISTPCGFVDTSDGKSIPVGLQILGPPMKESTILRIADAYEQSTDWLSIKP